LLRRFSVLGREPATRLERSSRGARPDPQALLSGLGVAIPERASGALHLSDESSDVAIEVSLEGAESSELEIGGGFAWFENALGAGSDLLLKVRPDGVEDYVHFEKRPTHERITYRVDVSRVKGVRFVERVVEFLDARGAPRLRMAAPYVFDQSRAVRPHVEVGECAHDSDPRPPWNRPLAPPLSKSCTITLDWSGLGIEYPALVDPVWSSADVMSVQRRYAAAAVVESGGKKYGVVTGGSDSTSILSSSEVFDSDTLTWATTGSMAQARHRHTATQLFASPASNPGQLVVAGGDSAISSLAGALASLERWDYVTGAWTALPSMAGPRIDHGAGEFQVGTLTNGSAILFTGGRFNGYEWVTIGEMLWYSSSSGTLRVDTNGTQTSPRAEHATLTLNLGPELSTVWNIGGIGPTAAGGVGPTSTTSLHGYGENAGPNLARARAHPGAAMISGNRAVVAGGENGGEATVEVVSQSGATVIGVLCTGCTDTDPSATKLPNGSALITGNKANQAWVADPDQPVDLLALPPMPTQRHASLALGFDEFVIVFGGQSNPATATDVFRLLQDGSSCQNAAECGSKNCVDGVCCNTACNGACQACSAATKQGGSIDGVCGNAKAGTDPGDQCPTTPASSCGTTGLCSAAGVCALHSKTTPCGGPASCADDTVNKEECDGVGNCEPVSYPCAPYTCDTNGGCGSVCPCNSNNFCSGNVCVPKQPAGSACTVDDQCTSGFCVDGFCCNTSCDDQCEACDVTGYEGECRAVAGAPHGDRPPCPGATGGDACTAQVCVASDTTKCAGFVGSEFPCRPQSCSEGLETFADECNGSGKCPDPKTKPCAPFLCGGSACKTSCESDDDCVSGGICGTDGKCVASATCLDEHTAQSADGKTEDCGMYRCQAGACPTSCAEVTDCAEGTICNAARACVKPESAPEDEAVCTCRGVGRPSHGQAGVLFLLLAGLFFCRRACGAFPASPRAR
jgi:hypothetical protein